MKHLFCRLIFAFFLIISGASLALASVVSELYEQAAQLMADGDLEKAQSIFDKAFATPGVEADSVYPLLLNEQATLYTWRGERNAAIAGKRAVLPMLDDFGNTELDISVYSDLGLLYNRSNRIDSATYFFEKADSAAKVFADPGWLACVKQNIGVMYYNLKRYDIAAQYLADASTYGIEAGDDFSVVNALQLLAIAQIEQSDTAAAGVSSRRAWQKAEASGNDSYRLRCIPSLYRYFEAVNRPDSVDYYMQIGETLYDAMPPNSVISQGYVMARARMHFNRRQWADALRWFDKQRHSPMFNDRASLYAQMAECCRHLGQYEMASLYADSARIITDSLANVHAAAMLEEFNVKYSTQERELEVATLKVQMLKRSRELLIVLLLAVILGAAAVIIWQRQRRTRRVLAEMRSRRELEISRHYIKGLEDERRHFAKELHDGIANDLLALKMKISTSGVADTESVNEMVDTTRDAVRRISHDLMPPEFESMTLSEVLSHYVASLNADSRVDVRFHAEAVPQMSSRYAREVYRVAQEYLMNVIRHSDATRATVELKGEDATAVRLVITDNSSLPVPDEPTATGIGLRTMADRARTMSATISRRVDPRTSENIFVFQFNIV